MTATPAEPEGTDVPVSKPERTDILRTAIGIGLYAAAFGASFGAVSIGSGLTVWQTMVLSLVLFSGASQFAFVGVVAAGSPFAAIPAALLLGVRNAFYGVTLSEILQPKGFARLWTAHFVIDETTAMAVSREGTRASRLAFWATGLILCGLWQVGTLTGALVGSAIDPADFGLDAAAPAVFLALLWPALRTRSARWVAAAGGLVGLALVPIAPAGVPVVASAVVAIVAGWRAPHSGRGAVPAEGGAP
ncbi:MAG: AzlC family ABC transporter permease [Propionibacteriaceae bacterium]